MSLRTRRVRPKLQWIGDDGKNVIVSLCGRLLTVRVLHKPLKQRGGMRGVCKMYSKGVRLRVLKWLARVDFGRAKAGTFITLTIPDDVTDVSGPRLKLFRQHFQRFLERQIGTVGVLWKVEWVPRLSGVLRGVERPHIHLCVFARSWFDWGAAVEAWSAIIHSSGLARCSFEVLESNKQACYYVSKYLAKSEQEDLTLSLAHTGPRGRSWGVFRPECIPMHISRDVRVAPSLSLQRLREEARAEWPGVPEDPALGFALLGDGAIRVGRQFLDSLHLTE